MYFLIIKHGDYVKVASGDGEIKGFLRLRNGVHPKTIGVEHGAGRLAEGAVDIEINGTLTKGLPQRKSGIYYNKIGLLDPSRSVALVSDFVCGSNARQAIPVNITRV